MIIKKLHKAYMKLFYKLTHSKKYYHNKNFWYLFSVSRDESNKINKITYKNEIIKLSNNLSLKKKKKELVIVATGPSICDINTNFFESKSYDFIGVNGAIALSNTFFTYYCIIDGNFVTARPDLIQKIVTNENLILFCHYNVLFKILEVIPFNQIACTFKVIELSIDNRPIQRFLQKEEDIAHRYSSSISPLADNFNFSVDIHDFVFDYGTVAYVALQVACYLGYNTIYIAGLDMNNFTEPRFYENKSNKLKTCLEKDFSKIKNAFEAAAKYCEAHQIKVINLSPNSSINSFEKTSFEKIIS